MRRLLLPMVGLLAGCVSAGFGFQDMSAEQIKAVNSKDSNVLCVETNSVYGRVRSVFVNVDQGVIDKGGLSVDTNCGVILSNERQFRPQNSPIVKPTQPAGVNP